MAKEKEIVYRLVYWPEKKDDPQQRRTTVWLKWFCHPDTAPDTFGRIERLERHYPEKYKAFKVKKPSKADMKLAKKSFAAELKNKERKI